MKSSLISSIVLILGGCGLNNLFLEKLVKIDANSGPFLTLFQFIGVSIYALLLNIKYEKNKVSLNKPHTPLLSWFKITFVYVLMSYLNNKAFSFHISQPFHITFRSSSLVASALIGFLFFKKSYSLQKLLSIISVTIGTLIVTFSEISAGNKLHGCCGDDNNLVIIINDELENENQKTNYQYEFIFGVFLLVIVLILSSVLGHIQENTYKTYGKNWKEGLLYQHLLGIPFFMIILSPKIMKGNINIVSTTKDIEIYNFRISEVCFYMIMNVITQCVCIEGVYSLTSSFGTLTCTLVLTLRKLLSLILSIWYFNNVFTLYHWIGLFFVITGTLFYSIDLNKVEEDSVFGKVIKDE